jgi:hypothetical protein
MKITIEVDQAGNIELNSSKAPAQPEATKNDIRVNSIPLLYKISDAGLLCHMTGFQHIGKHKIWLFEKHPDVQEVIEAFKAQRAKERLQDNDQGGAEE